MIRIKKGSKMEAMAKSSDNGAFMEKFTLKTNSSSLELPLTGLTFAVKDIFDIEGYVTGFGNPEWGRTHSAATSTAPAVLSLLSAGATCIGKTIMDEMAYSVNGENAHYGTPSNPCAPNRVPGGSSSGSAVAVGAKLVDFSLGTDTGGSVRTPAAYCGVFGYRPSHGLVSTAEVIPLAQCCDTVGWFARDSVILKQVGKVLLQFEESSAKPDKIIIPEDCFELLSSPPGLLCDVLAKSVAELYGSNAIQYMRLGKYIEDKVSSLKPYMDLGSSEYTISSLAAISIVSRSLQRHEFKKNHGKWITEMKPNFSPGIAERIQETLRSNEEIDDCLTVKAELNSALNALLGEFGILALPTVPGPPPELQAEPNSQTKIRTKALSLLSIATVSGYCQVSIPLGMYEDVPVSISLLAKHGSDGFLLSFVESIYSTLKEQFESVVYESNGVSS